MRRHDLTNKKTMRKTMTKTKCSKDPSHAIFSKSREFKDIKYNEKNRDKDKSKEKKYKDKDKYKIYQSN